MPRPRRLPAVSAAVATGLLLAGLGAAPAGAADPADRIDVDLTTDGDVSNATVGGSVLPGWRLPTSPSQDAEVAGGAFRLSNGASSPFFSHAGYITPVLGVTAGESTVADRNAFDASFVIDSATGDYQEGLSIGVSLEDEDQDWSRHGGVVYFAHEDGVLKIGAFWLDPAANGAARPLPSAEIVWTEEIWGEYDPAVPHDVRVVARFADGPRNDVVEYYVDGELVGEAPTWEGFAEVKGQAPKAIGSLGFFSGANTVSTAGLDVVANATRVPALVGGGFLFSDVSYRSYDVLPAPGAPPATLPSEPAATPDAPLTAPARTAPGSTVTVTASGFDPYENVAFTWFSTPRFAGWAQADAFGVVSASFAVPSALAGAAHTLQGVGERSGWIANATIAIAALSPAADDDELPPTGSEGAPLLAGAAALLVALGLALGAGGVLRRRAARA